MICFLLSAGGSAVFKAIELTEIDPSRVIIVSDRKCPALISAQEKGLETFLVEHNDESTFSSELSFLLSEKKVSALLLHYSKIVGPDIYQRFETYNVHPSILPSFPGLGAEKQASKYGALFQGASLHKVDGGIDTGQLVAQVITPTNKNSTINTRKKLSYVQKTILTTFFIIMHENPSFLQMENFQCLQLANSFINPGFNNNAIIKKLCAEIEKELNVH